MIEVKAILFDYGNTLELDPFETILQNFRRQLSERAASFGAEPAVFLDAWRHANKELNWQYASHFSQEEPFVQHALMKAGVSADVRAEAAPVLLAEYRAALAKVRTNDPQAAIVRQVFSGLKAKGKRVGIVSNDREWAPVAAMKAYGAFELLDACYTSEQIGIEKPNPAIFQYVCDDLGVKPEDLCYVGDDPVRDIQCPKQLGIKAVLFVPPGKYKISESWRDYNAKIAERPDAVITDLRELSQLIV